MSFSRRSSSFFIKSRLTILSFLSFKLSNRSRLTFFAISRIILVLMQDMSTWTLEISSMCSPIKSKHSRTSRSILRNSAGIRMVTAFLMSSFGPPYYMIAEFAKLVFSFSPSSPPFWFLRFQELLTLLPTARLNFSCSLCFFSYSSMAKM